ncbi:MAG: Rieske 2Fe-2S domain-containing protein [Acidobacteria bacterium]|nr:Rieske 2Fe-2S domain-containing protein [Acidobacteriota bacterium]
MLVLTFDPEKFNFVAAGDDSYFLLRFPDGSRVMFQDRCAHRGSPLHLGCWNAGENALVCSSHQTKYPERVLRRQGVPLIYRAGRVTVLLDVASHAEARLARKNILAQPDNSPTDTSGAQGTAGA